MMKAAAKCLAAILIGYAVAAVVSSVAGFLADSLALTREQLIENDPRVLSRHTVALTVVGAGGLFLAAALGALAATWVAARWVSSRGAHIVASGCILFIAIAQVFVIGRDLWLCALLLLIWPASIYFGHRLQSGRHHAA